MLWKRYNIYNENNKKQGFNSIVKACETELFTSVNNIISVNNIML